MMFSSTAPLKTVAGQIILSLHPLRSVIALNFQNMLRSAHVQFLVVWSHTSAPTYTYYNLMWSKHINIMCI